MGTATDKEDGNLGTSLNWTRDNNIYLGSGSSFSDDTLSDGSHNITATVDDSGGKTGSDSISITVGTPENATTVSVDSITYATEGGKDNDKHLLITVALVDDLGNSVASASVPIKLFRDGSLVGSGTGTTGTNGTVTFTLKNAWSGCYTTTVTEVTADGLTWDDSIPTNELCK